MQRLQGDVHRQTSRIFRVHVSTLGIGASEQRHMAAAISQKDAPRAPGRHNTAKPTDVFISDVARCRVNSQHINR